MEITLPADLAQFIDEQVRSGQFASPNELLCKAVENLQSLERRRAELKREIMIGVEQAERGEGVIVSEDQLDEFFENIKRRGREIFARNQSEKIA